jgi:hypothetical protein
MKMTLFAVFLNFPSPIIYYNIYQVMIVSQRLNPSTKQHQTHVEPAEGTFFTRHNMWDRRRFPSAGVGGLLFRSKEVLSHVDDTILVKIHYSNHVFCSPPHDRRKWW